MRNIKVIQPKPITDDELSLLEESVCDQLKQGLTPYITSETAMKLLLRLQQKMPITRYLK